MANEYEQLEQFGKRLEDILVTQGVTRRQLAADTCCTGASIGRWIRGEAPHSITVLIELHRKYNIDLNLLLCGRDK